MSVYRTLTALAVLMLALPVAGAMLLVGQAAPAPTPTFTNTYTPEVGAVTDTISAVGKLEANRVVGVGFQTSGRVTELLVKVGDRVEVGTVLARLDSTNQQLAYDQAVLALEQAQVSLQELRNSPTESELIAAQASLTSAQGNYSGVVQGVSNEDLQAAELRYQQAIKKVDDLKLTRSAMMEGLPKESYTIAEAQIGAAAFDAEIQRLQLENLRSRNQGPQAEAGASVELARLQLERTKLGAKPTQLAVAEVAITRAQARLAEAQTALDNTQLVSPVAGLITALNLQIGQPAAPGMAVIDITDDSQLWLVANVDEVDVDAVIPGQTATMILDALPGETFPAAVNQVAWINTLVNGVVNYPTRFLIANPDPRLRAGMTAEGRILVAERPNVLRVPNEFIAYRDDHAYVTRLLATGETRTVEVTVGLRGDTYTEIIFGLHPDDTLVVGGSVAG